MAFGQRVVTAAKVAPNQVKEQQRASSKSRDHSVSFVEPNSILKKESNFTNDDAANLVAVSDPNEFKFDDELTEGDQGMPEDDTEAMRMVQSK